MRDALERVHALAEKTVNLSTERMITKTGEGSYDRLFKRKCGAMRPGPFQERKKVIYRSKGEGPGQDIIAPNEGGPSPRGIEKICPYQQKRKKAPTLPRGIHQF